MLELIARENSGSSLAYRSPDRSSSLGMPVEPASFESQFGSVPTDLPVRYLQFDENLFQVNDLKTHIYKVETGIICISAPRLNRPPEIIELVHSGSLIGLGFLDRHIHNAKAVIDSSVSCYPLGAASTLVEQTEAAKRRQAEATEREFSHRRSDLIGSTFEDPVQRVASFLLAVSRLSEDEGQEPDIISDALSCGVVADYLGLDISTLGSVLVELQSRQLIECCPPQRIRLCDRQALETLAPLSW